MSQKRKSQGGGVTDTDERSARTTPKSTTTKLSSLSSNVSSTTKKNGMKQHSSSSLPSKITVKFVQAQNETNKPLICSFPGGVPVALDHDSKSNYHNDYYMNPPKFLIRRTEPNHTSTSTTNSSNTKNSTKMKTVKHTLIGRDDTCLYTASINLPKPQRVSSSSSTNRIGPTS